ncbi:cytochrome c3 family protein [Neobacillus niacini]|uniref:cytochrome c3 family protein n=1 Tax=Neobacillus niacini TaxID=86668 RepID=UPI003002CE1C
MNFKRKLISCIVIWSVVFGSLLSYSPENRVLSATGVPEITLIAPIGESVFEVSKVEFTGKILDDLTSPDKLLVKVFEQSNVPDQPIDITNEGQLIFTPNEQYLEFSYTKDFSEGNHKISFISTDEDGFSTSLEKSFTVKLSGNKVENSITTNTTSTQSSTNEKIDSSTTVDTAVVSASAQIVSGSRPYMANMYLIPKGLAGDYRPDNVPDSYLPAEDMTKVPLDYKILIDIRSTKEFNPTQPLITFFGESTGKEELVKKIDLDGGIKSYIYTFTPETEKLSPGKAYFVYLNPNELIPRFLKFTTVSDNYGNYQFEADKGNEVREKDYIHGPYSVVTNTCSFCHSTHDASNLMLKGGKYGSGTNNLCMACHDGTNGSPKLESNYATNKHNLDPNVSCTSCHDPHTPGTKENPNSFHANKGSDADKNPYLTYKKASTATGDANDATLCFKCHNGRIKDKDGNSIDKDGNPITDIEQYYLDDTNLDKKLKGQSGHNIIASIDSGSKLNGQMPCAECHETHGSKNIKMLRENLGNIKIDDPENLYMSTSGEWADEEREFCLKCHNNSTEIYGKTSKFKEINEVTGKLILGHQREDKEKNTPCSSCHGGAKQSAVEAAHAPKKGIHVTSP